MDLLVGINWEFRSLEDGSNDSLRATIGKIITAAILYSLKCLGTHLLTWGS
jgi:hypothetical protein